MKTFTSTTVFVLVWGLYILSLRDAEKNLSFSMYATVLTGMFYLGFKLRNFLIWNFSDTNIPF